MTVYKICPKPLWREAERSGSFVGAPVDLADGFVHLSTAAQVRETAARHFAGQSDLLLIAFPEEALGPALRFEPSRGGDLFPHLHGPLPVAAATAVEPLPLGPDGQHVFPPGIGEGGKAAELEAAGWTRLVSDRFVGLVGPLWSAPGGKGLHHGFVAEERHLNRNGVVHGGMIMTFADQALGMAAWAANGDRPQATIQLDTHFVSGAKLGDFVEARCRVVRQTRTLLFMAGELTAGDRVIANAQGVWKMYEPRG